MTCPGCTPASSVDSWGVPPAIFMAKNNAKEIVLFHSVFISADHDEAIFMDPTEVSDLLCLLGAWQYSAVLDGSSTGRVRSSKTNTHTHTSCHNCIYNFMVYTRDGFVAQSLFCLSNVWLVFISWCRWR